MDGSSTIRRRSVSAGSPSASRVQSVDRAALLLRAVASSGDQESSTAALARQVDLNRATAWRLLTTLESHGLVTCDRASGQWSIGLGLAYLVGSTGLDRVRQRAHAALEELSRRSGETAALAVISGAGPTYVDEVAGPAIITARWRGRTVPVHATSTGKAFLAAGTTWAAGRTGELDLERFTDRTITEPDALAAEVDLARRRGYATCRGEYEPFAWGVSSAVVDGSGHPLAVVSIWGPSDRVNEPRFGELGALVLRTARDLSRTTP